MSEGDPTPQDEMAACPFCGASDSRIVQAQILAGDVSIWSVECLDCGAERASDDSQAEADVLWNQRPTQDGPSAEVVERVAALIEGSLVRHGVDLANCEGTLDDAEEIIAAMPPTAATVNQKREASDGEG